MKHKLKAETFFREIEFFTDVQSLPLKLSFVIFQLKAFPSKVSASVLILGKRTNIFSVYYIAVASLE